MSEMKAICEPSGDQLAHLSCAPEECVRFRVGPFSTGAVNTSPRATNNARSPFGLNPTDSIKFAADTRLGRRALPSSGTLIEIGVLFFVLCRAPGVRRSTHKQSGFRCPNWASADPTFDWW